MRTKALLVVILKYTFAKSIYSKLNKCTVNFIIVNREPNICNFLDKEGNIWEKRDYDVMDRLGKYGKHLSKY